MKNVGIWIDKRVAKIVSIKDGNDHLDTIVSNIEEFHPSGGSGTRVKGGPQNVVQDSKYLEWEKHQLAKFFKDIVICIAGADAIVIFGPAQTGEKLHKELLGKHSLFHHKIITIEKADIMTDNQIISCVKDYYISDKEIIG